MRNTSYLIHIAQIWVLLNSQINQVFIYLIANDIKKGNNQKAIPPQLLETTIQQLWFDSHAKNQLVKSIYDQSNPAIRTLVYSRYTKQTNWQLMLTNNSGRFFLLHDKWSWSIARSTALQLQILLRLNCYAIYPFYYFFDKRYHQI